jgi:uncharacterized protein (DUF1015 family)
MRWAEEIPADFVLMGLTSYDDPGLLVLPTHRLVHRAPPGDGLEKLGAVFAIESLPQDDLDGAVARLRESDAAPSFVAIGLRRAELHLLTLRGRSRVEALMPDQPAVWKRLDVNVLQYGVLLQVFGIDDAALTAGGAVSYTQDAADAHRAVASGEAKCAFLLNATPVEQVLEVSDVNGRMPQKSTFFYPKLPTGLVMRALD